MSDPDLVAALRTVQQFATRETNATVARWCQRRADILAADDKASIEIGRQLYEMAEATRVRLVEQDLEYGDDQYLALGRKARQLVAAAEVTAAKSMDAAAPCESDSAAQEARL